LLFLLYQLMYFMIQSAIVSIYSLHPRMFVVSKLVNKYKKECEFPFCPAASPSRLHCPHPRSSRPPPLLGKTDHIPHVPLAASRAFSLYTRRRPTPAVPSPVWNNKIFYFDFIDFTLPYEELFGAPEPEPEREPEVKEIVASSGSSRLVHPILLPSSPGLVSYGVCFCFDDFVSILNGGDYWDIRFPFRLEMRLLHLACPSLVVDVWRNCASFFVIALSQDIIFS
jgi:hypothetical protein